MKSVVFIYLIHFPAKPNNDQLLISLAHAQLPQFLSKEINVLSFDSHCLVAPLKTDFAKLCAEIGLTPFEQKQLAARKQISQQANFMMSRYAIKQCCSQWFHCESAAVEVKFNENTACLQAFYDEQLLPVSISLSHSKHKLLLCLAFDNTDVVIGADIEFIKPNRDFIAMAREVYSPQEITAIERSTEPLVTFYQLWTEKEAFAKALKQPLRLHLSTQVNAALDNQQLGLSNKRVGSYMLSIVHTKKADLCWH